MQVLRTNKFRLTQTYRGWILDLVHMPEVADTYFRGQKSGKTITSQDYDNLLHLIDQEESK